MKRRKKERFLIRRMYFPQVKDLPVINKLMNQLSGKKRRLALMKAHQVYVPAFVDEAMRVYAARDRKFKTEPMVGIAAIYFVQTLNGLKSGIEDVVVDKKYRGLGLGKKLVRALIGAAKRKKAKYIDLTSNPKRVEANALYQKLGFKKRETNVYRLELAS